MEAVEKWTIVGKLTRKFRRVLLFVDGSYVYHIFFINDHCYLAAELHIDSVKFNMLLVAATHTINRVPEDGELRSLAR